MAEHSTVEDSEAASTSGESSESTRSSQLVSFLDQLKSPRPSDLARKRMIGTNPPPKGKRTCHGQGTTATEPKGVTPAQRVREFADEALTVSSGRLFCSACREELNSH